MTDESTTTELSPELPDDIAVASDEATHSDAADNGPEAPHSDDTVDSEDTDDTVDVAFDLTDDAAAGEDEVEEVIVDDPWTRPGAWYVVHTQSGYEKKVTANLGARIQSMNMEDRIYEVVIPMEEVEEFKNGRKQTVQKKVFPGYLLVRCIMDDNSWYCIRNTPEIGRASCRERV